MRVSRSLIVVALSAAIFVSLFVIAWVARRPDRRQCATTQVVTTQTFRGSPVKMGVTSSLRDLLWGLTKTAGTDQGQNFNWPVDWGRIEEDEGPDPDIHCGEMMLHNRDDMKSAMGEWPIQEAAVGCGEEVLCQQNVADPGTGTTYPCDRISLQSFIPLSDFNSSWANDVWGWSDPETGSEYAIVGLKEGTAFVDITNPTRPALVGILPTASKSIIWRDIKVFGNNAYIVSEAAGHGMQVFDLTRLRGRTAPPSGPFTADALSRDINMSHNLVVNVETGRAYAVGSRWWRENRTSSKWICRGGLAIFDISDPDATKPPRFEGCYSDEGYTHDAQCVVYHGEDTAHRGKEICFAYNAVSLAIVDVSRAPGGEWRDPTLISRTDMSEAYTSYIHQGWLDDDHAFAYVNDEYDEYGTENKTRTFIMDVRDLDNPVIHDIHVHNTISIDHNNYVKDGFLYQANYCAGLRILRIRADHRLDEVAYFDTDPQCDENKFEGTWSVYPWLPSGNLVVSSVETGLFVLKANLPPRSPSAAS